MTKVIMVVGILMMVMTRKNIEKKEIMIKSNRVMGMILKMMEMKMMNIIISIYLYSDR